MTMLLQEAVDEAAKLARENGLQLSPEKTVALLFSKKKQAVDVDTIPPKLNGQNIKYVDSVKHQHQR